MFTVHSCSETLLFAPFLLSAVSSTTFSAQADPLFNSQLRSPHLYETFLVTSIRLPGTCVLPFWSHGNLFTPLVDYGMQALYCISTCLHLTTNTELCGQGWQWDLCPVVSVGGVGNPDIQIYCLFFFNKKSSPISFLCLLNDIIISMTVLALWAINLSSQMTINIHINKNVG